MMPHLQMYEVELAARHPSILAPPEEPLHGLAHDASDHVYQQGLALAQRIQSDRHARQGPLRRGRREEEIIE